MSKKHLHQTLGTDPDEYSFMTSQNRLASLGYALAGLIHMLRYAKNFRIQVIGAAIVVAAGLWAQLNTLEWAIIIFTIGLNLFAECVNAAIEAVVNLASPQFHPMAKLAKDTAAGAVLLVSFMAVVIAGLLLMPPLWERVS